MYIVNLPLSDIHTAATLAIKVANTACSLGRNCRKERMKTLPIFLLILTAVACASAKSCKWIGTAPFCSGHASDCTDSSGFSYYWYSSRTGDGKSCWTGNKVFCCNVPPDQTEEENLNMALLRGEPRQPEEMEGSDPGRVLAYANYDKIIPEN